MGLTRSAALDYAKQGIRINAVNPGNIATEGLNRVFEKLGVTADAVTAMVPMGRIAQAEEVAQVVVFLCSDAASYITGQSLGIDGGYTANSHFKREQERTDELDFQITSTRRDSMSTFVLVHGSWHDGSAWQAVIDQLQAKGHHAFAPTIAGHGKGVNKNVNHAQCTQSIVDYIVSKDLNDIVLVGHSFGGTIIAKVAEAISDGFAGQRQRIRRLIFFNAFVLNDGESLNDNTPPHSQALSDQLARQ